MSLGRLKFVYALFYSLLGPRHAFVSSKFESQVATTSELMASAGICEEVQGVP